MIETGDEWDWVFESEEGSTACYTGRNLAPHISAGERVSQLRQAAGLSVQEVEDYTGISKSNVLALEAGLLQLNPTMAAHLAVVLDVSIGELLNQE